jgi:type II secretory pathway pseudopilin PulG
MKYQNNRKLLCGRRRTSRGALTLLEMVMALAMMAIVFAAIVPLFRQIRDGWDSKQAAAETLQNGRILIDHMNRNLAKAVKITAVSDSSEPNGYIEF